MKGTSSLRDEIKEERNRLLEGKSTGYKIKYYVYYYKWYAIGIIAAIILIASVIHSIRTSKDPALGVAVINADYEADYDFTAADFGEYIDIDEKHVVQIDHEFYVSADGEGAYDLQAEEKLFVIIATGQIDVLIAPESVFKKYADLGYLTDITEILSESDMPDEANIFTGHVADDSVEAVDDANAPRHDERSGINITDFKVVKDGGWYAGAGEKIYLGFIPEGGNLENAVKFYDYLKGR